MSDRSLPYYRWYVADYRASRAVQRMTYIERGLYRTLIDECWVEGAIPDDIEQLADICDCPRSVMAKYWPTLRPRFTALEGSEGGYLTKPRLEIERTEMDKLRTVRALAGQKGGQAPSKPKQSQANASKAKQTQANDTAVKAVKAEQSSSSSKSGTFASPVRAQMPAAIYDVHGRPALQSMDMADGVPPTAEQRTELARVRAALKAAS